MNILLFSDNHRDREAVKTVLRKHPDMDHYISLGDSEMKEHELTALNIYGVIGNYPFEPKFPPSLTLVFEDLKVFLTHGHHFSVKLGLTRLINHGKYNDIDIICFGHTHTPLIKDIDGLLLINPGALSKQRTMKRYSYAILTLTKTMIDVLILDLSGKTIAHYHRTR